jgi:hypothetical protein
MDIFKILFFILILRKITKVNQMVFCFCIFLYKLNFILNSNKYIQNSFKYKRIELNLPIQCNSNSDFIR